MTNNYIFARLNTPIDGHKEGQLVRILTDGRGTAVSMFWRRRIKDAEMDNCLKILKKIPKKGYVNA